MLRRDGVLCGFRLDGVVGRWKVTFKIAAFENERAYQAVLAVAVGIGGVGQIFLFLGGENLGIVGNGVEYQLSKNLPSPASAAP